MRRILLSLASAAVLTLPAAAAGAGASTSARSGPGFLVVRKGTGDGGITGHPVVTVVVQGFVLGRVSQEGRVDVYHLASAAGQGAPQVAGAEVSRSSVRWRGVTGSEYVGSDFRFRAIGGAYRVVVRGSGIYLFVGGRGNVTVRGSAVYPTSDGLYSLNGAPFRSLPSRSVHQALGGG